MHVQLRVLESLEPGEGALLWRANQQTHMAAVTTDIAIGAVAKQEQEESKAKCPAGIPRWTPRGRELRPGRAGRHTRSGGLTENAAAEPIRRIVFKGNH